MRRNLFFLIFGLIAVSLIFAIGYAGESEGDNNGGEAMEYEVMEELSRNLKEAVRYVKNLRGFGIIRKIDDEAVIYIGSGEKPTGGYSISVESVKKVDDTTEIRVVETSPGEDEMVTQALTYPHVVIRVENITENVKVVNDEGKVFEDINDETKEAEYFDSK